MINYDYVCNNCGYEVLDVEQSIKDKALRHCPDCNKDGLQRVIYGGSASFIKKEPTTVGQMVEKCTKERKNKMGSDCDKKETKTVGNPHLTANNSEIKKMNKKKLERYIMEGKK
jgi:putative FmdB family regulatory protein